MKIKIKLCAIIFALLCTAIILMPNQVFASEVSDEATLKTALEGTDATITLKGDIEITETLKTSRDFTIDLNGYKIIGPDDGKSNWYAFVVEDGVFTLKDTSKAQTGEIYAKCYGVETKGGTFVMESGKITATKNGGIGAAIVNYGGKVEVKGGTLLASNWSLNAQAFFADMEVVISGGSFETTSTTNPAVQIGGEYSKKEEDVAISGGIFKGTNAFAVSPDSEASVIITGGTFSTDISDYLSKDTRVEKDENGNYIVFEVHDIVVNATKGGTVTVSQEKAIVGEIITLTLKTEDGYKLNALKINGVEIKGTTFTMPDEKVIVTAEFEKIPYAVKIEDTANGKVTASVEEAVEGEIVELTVTPDTGYELSKLTVNGTEVVGGKFTMPGEEVTIVAEFKKIPVVDFVVPEDKTENNNIGIVENETVKETLNSSLKADTELNKKVEEAKEKGEDVVIEVKVEELEKDNVKEEEKQQILQTVAANQTVHQYFDISVLVTANEKELGKITQLTEKMKFSMEISKDLLKEGRKFFILKLHGDKVEKIEATLNGTKLEFETDQFSTFALAYEDGKIADSGEGEKTEQPKEDIKPEETTQPDVPNTGDNIVLYVLLAVVALSGIIVMKKANTKKSKK